MSDFFHHSCLELHEPFQTQVFLQTTEKFLSCFKIMASPPCVAFFLLGFVLFPYDVSWVFLRQGLGFSLHDFWCYFCLAFCILSSIRFPKSPSSPPIHLKLKIMFPTLGKYFLSHLIFFFNACVVFSSSCCSGGCGLTLLWFWMNCRLLLLPVGFLWVPIVVVFFFPIVFYLSPPDPELQYTFH